VAEHQPPAPPSAGGLPVGWRREGGQDVRLRCVGVQLPGRDGRQPLRRLVVGEERRVVDPPLQSSVREGVRCLSVLNDPLVHTGHHTHDGGSARGGIVISAHTSTPFDAGSLILNS
jgi:hypothetical protein